MKYEINNEEYNVIIERKNNKNIYIRVKDDLNIYVYCNKLVPKFEIKRLLDLNIKSIEKMINSVKKNKTDDNKLLYLGKSYDIIYTDTNKVYISDDKVIAKDKKMLDKWYKDKTLDVFDERYVYIFNKFNEDVKSPILKIRTMKTRWGVYNRKNHTITLNSRLIEFDTDKIDYVIIHELSHIKHFDHSKAFWSLVSKYCPNYKSIRKEMK